MVFKSDKQRKFVMAKLKAGSRSSISPVTFKKFKVRKGIVKPTFVFPNYSITSISDKSKLEEIRNGIDKQLHDKGFTTSVSIKNGSVKLSGIRVSEQRIKDKGHNVQQKFFDEGHKRTRALAWDDWVKVNNTVNDVLDSVGVKANVKSLGGKFDIRDKVQGRRVERDWEFLATENIGSQMRPIARIDFILTPEQARERGIELKKLRKKRKPMVEGVIRTTSGRELL